jgi:hypothetical protein
MESKHALRTKRQVTTSNNLDHAGELTCKPGLTGVRSPVRTHHNRVMAGRYRITDHYVRMPRTRSDLYRFQAKAACRQRR